MPNSPSTPQSLRKPDKHLWVRQQQEQEAWDDMASAVFSVYLATGNVSLSVPMVYPGVLQVAASALLGGAGTLTLNVDASPQTPTATGTGVQTVTIGAAVTVTGGLHTLTLSSGVGITQQSIVVRRGRVPSP